MKLLLITQKVDTNDPILGFFHRWIEAFSKHYESLVVICLQKGAYDLPGGVRVFSLGKEHKELGIKKNAVWKKITYVWNFYCLIWRERRSYDAVFVHMNQEYVLLGALVWKILGKKVVLWYNHTHGNILTRVAIILADTVCHTSPFAFTAETKKSQQMPAGIDTGLFRSYEGSIREPRSIMYLGRIAPLKRVDVLLEAAKILDEQKIDFVLDIYGDAAADDFEYMKRLKEFSMSLQKKNKLFFRGAVPNSAAPKVFNTHLVSVNLTPKGNYDKTVLESMACETLPLVSSPAFADIIPLELRFKENDPVDLAKKITFVFSLPDASLTQHRNRCRREVENNHALVLLAFKLTTIFS